jgi:hypothetical protein
MRNGCTGSRCVGIFQSGFSFVLARFCIHWEVDFYDLAVKAKDDSKVTFDDVAREVGDYDDLGFRLRVG